MADGIVQLPADSTGKKVRTIETTVGGNTVEQQVVSFADAAGNIDSAGVKIADGASAALGHTTDAAITSDSPGAATGFLRGLVKMIASAWDSVNGRIKVDASGTTVPVSFSPGAALPVRAEDDTFVQMLVELRRVRVLLESYTDSEVSIQDVEVQ